MLFEQIPNKENPIGPGGRTLLRLLTAKGGLAGFLVIRWTCVFFNQPLHFIVVLV